VDVYAGVDFTKDRETYAYMGTQGGYVDGEVNVAEFKYPISLALSREEDNMGIATGVLYVADRFNDAIRRVANIVDTPAPSISFAPTPVPSVSYSPTHKPTHRPSSPRPTISFSPTYSQAPSPLPSTVPSYSLEPTFNPTKRPSKKPTPRPSHRPSFSPTKVQVIVEDVSLFHHLGLGTYHVTTGAMALSMVLGLFLAGMIVAGYLHRSQNPHRRLRTSDLDLSMTRHSPDDDFDSASSLEGPNERSCRGYSQWCCSLARNKWRAVSRVVGAVVWGRLYSLSGDEDGDDIGGGMELSVNGSQHSVESSASLRRILQTLREGSSHHSPDLSSSSASPYFSSSRTPPPLHSSHPSLNHSTASPIRISSLSHGSDGL
jgi:hypothetical protein